MPRPNQTSNSVTLSGGLPGTKTFLYTGPDGEIVIELFDFSEQAHSSFGNDVAFILHVAPQEIAHILLLLKSSPSAVNGEIDADVISVMRGLFPDYYAVKTWLDSNQIPYRKEFDSWA